MELILDQVTKTYPSSQGEVQAIDKISLEIKSGDFVCFVGPSGCGKSTLLNIIAGLDHASSGSITVDGKKISGPGTDRVVIFQESGLFPWLNVIKNVEIGLEAAGLNAKQRREVAMHYLKLVHLSKFAHSQIHELSGGMRHRVAIARGLALQPKILLMDEPFAALDSQTRDFLHMELQEIWLETKQTIIFVTHNVREAVRLGERVMVFSSRPARIRNEFEIHLSRPRDINCSDVIEVAGSITQLLQEEVDKVYEEEVDEEWKNSKNSFLRSTYRDLGRGI